MSSITNLGRTYDISSDGRRFLAIKQAAMPDQVPPAGLVVVQNWLEELKQRVPVR